jgi:transcriptional regulator with GAF, ATPase, and Fis domain
LTSFFVERFARQLGKQGIAVAQETVDVLTQYDWPGNVRELQNVIERAVVLSQGPILRLGRDLLPFSNEDPEAANEVGDGTSSHKPKPEEDLNASFSLQQVEKRHILEVLAKTEWVIEGPRGAAKLLDLHPNTLRSRMKRLGIGRSLSSRPHEISQPRTSN